MRYLLLLAFACRETGETKYVTDRDEDGIGEDDDCNDEDASVGSPVTYYADYDHDGHGDAATGDAYCERPAGYVETGDDCDDNEAAAYPGNTEACDGIDNDCDGTVDNGAESVLYYADADGDGYGDDASTVYDCTPPEGYATVGGDCDDADAAYNPGALEEDCEDPNDYNCDGSVGYADNDGDGHAACSECNDGDATVFPGASESCNGVDDDCDGATDEEAVDTTTYYADNDADGHGDASAPAELCGLEEGYSATADDCDDTRADISPSATEACNGLDDDCDGLVDDADDSLDTTTASTWYADGDADGYGGSGTALACEQPAGYSSLDGDCDDTDAAYNPGASETDCADPADYNCDGSVGYDDADGDGYAACEECDDGDAAINPLGTESCDGADNDCDGEVDEDSAVDASTWYADADGDGYGDATSTTVACDAPGGYLADATDCDDTSGDVSPAATELCNGIDDDCDGSTDEDSAADAGTWYADADGDGHGDAASSSVACEAPAGSVADATDCDDTSSDVSPSATELCNGVDDNCDGNIDEDDALDAATWYADADGDGHGDAATSAVDCEQPSGYVGNDSDCDDTSSDISPSATELCNGIDDDCDGSTDEDSAADAGTWYADDDGDGYGDAGDSTVACSAPAGSVADSADCDDTDEDVNPAASEVCDGIDNDCDGSIDPATSADASTWYADADGDGYGDASTSLSACEAPAGYLADDSDCDDTSNDVSPVATEVCDGVDNDCDGSTDPDDAWWDTSFPYRILLTVTAPGYDVDSPPVLADVDFRGALDSLGDSGAWDSDTLRVVTQTCASGQVELPSQYIEDYVGLLDKVDAADTTTEYGTVAFLLDSDGDYGTLDSVAAGTTVSIGLYFGGSNAAPAYATDLVATSSSLANDLTTASFDDDYGGVLSGLSFEGSGTLETQATSCCGNSFYGASWGIDPQDGTGTLAVLLDGPVVAAVEATGSRSDSQSGYEYSYIYLAFAGRPELYSKVYQVTDRASTLAHPSDITYGIRPWESRRDNISSGATFTTDTSYLYADVSNGTRGSAFAYVAPPEFVIGLSNYDPYLIAVSNDYAAVGLGTPATIPAGTAYFDHVVQLHLPHAGDFDSDVQDTLFALVEGVLVVQAGAEAR